MFRCPHGNAALSETVRLSAEIASWNGQNNILVSSICAAQTECIREPENVSAARFAQLVLLAGNCFEDFDFEHVMNDSMTIVSQNFQCRI